jgi:mannose-6-phosphate isomerase-like protein (cupin superfamily)
MTSDYLGPSRLGAVDYLAPDQSEIRLLSQAKAGGIAHCTLPPGRISLAVRHKSVEEIWFVLEGAGQVWRDFGGHKHEIVDVEPGVSLVIPPRTAFQFRNTGASPLTILIATMPPWPGAEEADRADDHWPIDTDSRTNGG